MSTAEELTHTGTRPAREQIDPVSERAIVALINRSTRLADDQDFLGWMDLFADDGEYSAITYENLKYKRLRLFRDVGRGALYERVAFLMGMLQVPRGKTVHLVGAIEVDPGETADEASATSNFIVARTGELEHTKLYAAGRYEDRFVRRDGVWRYKEHLVVVDSNLLPAEFTELL